MTEDNKQHSMRALAKAVLFDLDGTLLDTLQDLADSGNDVLRARGFPTHSTDAYRVFVGNGMARLAKDIFPAGSQPETEEEIRSVLADYRDAYVRNWQNTTHLFPGIAELLDALRDRGIPFGVVSNKAHDFTVRCVDRFLNAWDWDVVFGQCEERPRKPDPSGALDATKVLRVAPEDCLFVGDSDVDIQTGQRAGMCSVGVAWGFRGGTELVAAGADRLVETPSEILEMVRK